MLGTYLRQHYHGRCYAKAQNLRPGLRASYDAVLQHVGALAMPTTPMKAYAYRPQLGIQELIMHGWNRLGNTVPFDRTRHPSISIPCAQSDGLPVGLMRTERHFDDATVLAVAHAFEPQVDWRNAEAQGEREGRETGSEEVCRGVGLRLAVHDLAPAPSLDLTAYAIIIYDNR